jgi:hypothetical protein
VGIDIGDIKIYSKDLNTQKYVEEIYFNSPNWIVDGDTNYCLLYLPKKKLLIAGGHYIRVFDLVTKKIKFNIINLIFKKLKFIKNKINKY